MSPLVLIIALAAAAGWAIAFVALVILPKRQRAREGQTILRLRTTVEPYLQRRAANAGIAAAPLAPSVRDLDRVSEELASVARQLIEHERGDIGTADTLNIAISDTMPSGDLTPDGEK